MATATEAVKLIIRTTNNKYTDFSIDIPSSLTVYDLKQRITSNHPTKPLPKHQRLIYSGKLLEDKHILHQVLTKSNISSPFMVHLVLDSEKNESSPKTPQQTTSKSSVATKESPFVSIHSTAYDQCMNELNTYQQQLQQFMLNPYENLFTPHSETQTYLQYCYTHHQMYQNYLAHQTPTITNNTSIPSTTNQTTTTPPLPVPPPPAANNNEVEQENDLLRTLYIIIEVFILCSIIYFYSTFNRLLLVFAIFALLYLHYRGYFSVHRHRRVQVQQAPPVVERAAENGVEERIDEEANAEPNPHDIQSQESPPSEPAADNQITPTRLLLTAVTTFFSSLIPERPQRL